MVQRILFFVLFFYNYFNLIVADWKQVESNNFILIYDQRHESLSDHILLSAEKAFHRLSYLFKYSPSDKIYIHIYDYSDYGSAAAATLPANYIKLELSPLEPGYENTPYTERLEWLINHELVHIFVNDFVSGITESARSVFQKTVPEKTNPLTIFYSLLTSPNRFSPRWHQEAIAVFCETWLSGGYGRIMGSFEEMYFRSLVYENKSFLTWKELEAYAENDSFLIGSLFYLYGTRFITYLSIKYDLTKLLDWYASKDISGNFSSKFEQTFNISLEDAWQNYIDYEKSFQLSNIQKLSKNNFTEISVLDDKNPGWVSHPCFDSDNKKIYYALHKAGTLASIREMDLNDKTIKTILSLPTPGKYLVSSIAFDQINKQLFYTTNNSNLYRDIYSFDIRESKKKLLFENCRIGNISFSQQTRELWGIMHRDGRAALVRSVFPYNDFFTLIAFEVGDEILHLAVSPSGKYLTAVIHRPDGSHYLAYGRCKDLSKSFRYKKISSTGSPEFPSWSADEKFIYWNSFVNGVSNIYRYNLTNEKIDALTHTILGLFNPVEISQDSLFAFEFTTDGFVPVKIKKQFDLNLSAIVYMGDELLEKKPVLMNIASPVNKTAALRTSSPEIYSGFSNINIASFNPVISGFKNKYVLGLFAKFNDPLLYHNLSLEMGIAPRKREPESVHFNLKYEYKTKYGFEYSYNPTDFYDLFSKRKKGFQGSYLKIFNKHYWIYDNPNTLIQETEFTFYKGISSLNENSVKVSVPDILYFQTKTNYKSLRKSIGSCDYENGLEANVFAGSFTGLKGKYQSSFFTFSDLSFYNTWLTNHNVYILSLSGGYQSINKYLPFAQFYFGSFGNREIDCDPVKQYRETFSFPGVEPYAVSSHQFIKLSLENNFPPVRFYSLSFFNHFLSHIDYSIFSQLLVSEFNSQNTFANAGIQLNLIFDHWYNIETTFSVGYAKSFRKFNCYDDEVMISFKLLKN